MDFSLPDNPSMDQEFHRGDVVKLKDGSQVTIIRIGSIDYEVETSTGEKRIIGIDDLVEEDLDH